MCTYRKYKFIMCRLHNHKFFECKEGRREREQEKRKKIIRLLCTEKENLRAQLDCEFTVQPSQFSLFKSAFHCPSHSVKLIHSFVYLLARLLFAFFSFVYSAVSRSATFSVSNDLHFATAKTKPRNRLVLITVCSLFSVLYMQHT